MQQKIVILDFGSQTTQLIGRRVRELDTFCEILPYNKFPKDDPSVIGVILSGSPYSVHDPEAFQVDLSQFIGRLPVLGICYGAQFISHTLGGKVEKADSREYGRAHLQTVDTHNALFKGFEQNSQVWMSHGDTITAIPEGFEVIASTADVKYAAYASTKQPVWAVQFHPEVFHSVQGTQLLRNFVVDICGSRQDWSAASFVDTTVAELKRQLGEDRVILGLSGGVDSSVAAMLLHRAIGHNLTCIFVDHGMLRKNEFSDVMNDYKCLGLNVVGVDASDKFFADLAGVTDPEQKRKIIGRDFVEVFNAEAKKIEGAKWLAQGTIYPDRIESPRRCICSSASLCSGCSRTRCAVWAASWVCPSISSPVIPSPDRVWLCASLAISPARRCASCRTPMISTSAVCASTKFVSPARRHARCWLPECPPR